uniref:Uncharacterized protein n=2 Tax=Brassica oleracea TaxID=3712 RepID=A0A0D3BZN9_BRAOL|nr:unnamed protein product [Brassica oleracea]
MFVNKINNRFHLFKWADGSALEEIEDMKMKFFNLERASRSLVKDNKNFNSELEILIMDTCACESVVTGLEKELRGFEKELQDSKMEAAMAIRSYFGVFMMYFGDDHL